MKNHPIIFTMCANEFSMSSIGLQTRSKSIISLGSWLGLMGALDASSSGGIISYIDGDASEIGDSDNYDGSNFILSSIGTEDLAFIVGRVG